MGSWAGEAMLSRARKVILDQPRFFTPGVFHDLFFFQLGEVLRCASLSVHRARLAEPFRLICSGRPELDLVASYGRSKSIFCVRDSWIDSWSAKRSELTLDGRAVAAAEVAGWRLLGLVQHLQAAAAQGEAAQEHGRIVG